MSVKLMDTGKPAALYRVLSLDGGGAKGFYTLGVLKEVEAMVGKPLYQCFDLIFGTSTGGIIAALLGLGYEIDDIHALYKDHVPEIMRRNSRREKSDTLRNVAESIFKERTFADMKTGVGIVATRWATERPMIFKSDVSQAHGRKDTFVPGFGCTIADAVQASCSAYPFFEKHTVTTGDGSVVELIDGGYCANNPTLYAIADAVKALGHRHANIRVVSVGVGNYPEPRKRRSLKALLAKYVEELRLLQKTLNVNTASMEQLRAVLFDDIATVRINDTFERPEMATDLLESDLTKLNMLYQRGGDSFASREADLRRMLIDDVLPMPVGATKE